MKSWINKKTLTATGIVIAVAWPGVGRSLPSVDVEKSTQSVTELAYTKKGKLVPPTFSHESGFYPEEFELTLSHPDPDVTIYYTLDGSDPDPGNLKGSTFRYKNEYAQPPATEPTGKFLYQEYKTYKYSKPIKIKNRTYEPDRLSKISTTFDKSPDYFPTPKKEKKQNIYNKLIGWLNGYLEKLNHFRAHLSYKWHKIKTGEKKPLDNKIYYKPLEYQHEDGNLYKGTPVKALAVDRKDNKSKVLAKTLFIGEQSQFSLPIINITVPEKNLFDYDEGIFVAGVDYDEWIKKLNPESNTYWRSRPGNFKRKSNKINRTPVFVSFIEKENSFDISASIRSHGGGSAPNKNKSFKLYPKQKDIKKYNISVFNNDIFHDYRIVLRNAGNNAYTDYIKDAVVHGIANGLEIGVLRYSPKIIFINGEYYGIRNARDKKDAYYVKHTFGLPSRNIDLLKGENIVDHGDNKEYKQLISDIKSFENKNSYQFYKFVSEQIDLESFIDYFVLSIYYARTDWPGNNIAYWKYRGEAIKSNKYTDGRWRWILYDADSSFSTKHNTIAAVTSPVQTEWGNPSWSTFLFRSMLENPIIKEKFIIRFTDLSNSWFLSSRAIKIVENIEKNIDKEMPRHIERWGSPESMENWRKHVGRIKKAIERRPEHQWQHLQGFFELDNLYQVKIDINQKSSGKIKLNTLTLGDNPNKNYATNDTPLFLPWQGQYFRNLPLTLEAVPAEGYEFSHWQVKGMQVSQKKSQSLQLVLHPEQDVQITAVMTRVH